MRYKAERQRGLWIDIYGEKMKRMILWADWMVTVVNCIS